jgi:hypothetical protein
MILLFKAISDYFFRGFTTAALTTEEILTTSSGETFGSFVAGLSGPVKLSQTKSRNAADATHESH